jgi:hypothetical protein
MHVKEVTQGNWWVHATMLPMQNENNRVLRRSYQA